MDTAFEGSVSGPRLELLDDTLALANHSKITTKWIENWKTPDTRIESVVNIMYQKVSEMEALTKVLVLAPGSEDLKKEIVQRKVEWDKCNVELLKGIAFKKIAENETLQKEARVLLTDVSQKEMEIGIMRRKAEDNKLRTEWLESQLVEKSKATTFLEMRLKEKDFIMNISRRRVEADAQSEEAYRLECDVIYESFRAAFLDTESRYIQLEKEPSETPLKSVESKRMRDSEQSAEPNVSVKRKVLISNVSAALERKEQGNEALEGELEMLTLEQYRDAMSESTGKKKRLQRDVSEVADEELIKKLRK